MVIDKTTPITTLFLDIGGVLLSNGWGHVSRKLAAQVFNLDSDEMEERHLLNKGTLESGKLTLKEYLQRVVFFEERTFTPDQFQAFMFTQTTPHLEMIELIQQLKKKYQLKIAAVSNEGRELNAYRIKAFKLNQFVDFFISSCYVHLSKPDLDIFRLALDMAQVPAEQIVYIDDTLQFVEIARDLGIWGIRHTSHLSTSEALAVMGLEVA